MSSLQQPNRFIPFSSCPQRPQLSQGGFPQSLSGSETDVSTSNENLSNEERYVIRHTARQEPQGQENLSSNRSSLDVSSSSYNTLIIHGAGDEPWTGRLSGIRDLQDTGTHTSDATKMGSHSPSPGITKDSSNRSGYESSTTNRIFDPNIREITDIPDDYLSQSQVLKHLAKEVKVVPSPTGANCDRESSVLRDTCENKSVKGSFPENTTPGLSDQIKRLSLSRSGKETNRQDNSICDYDLRNLPPPPQYPKWVDVPRLATLSRSQPDLSRVGVDGIQRNSAAVSPRPKTNGREDLDSRGREIWPPAEMVEILIQENSSLKLELENCYQKVAKSQKLEQEVAKIHRAHGEMVLSSERRERLERAARGKLQSDCRRLQELNRALKEQIELFAAQLRPQANQAESGEGLRKELTKRELLIAQLITQNKELVAAKERQEIELAAQRATLQEQRTHIDILDTALTNAQGNVVRLEEECRKKQMYVERVAQLQRTLASLQSASDRREQTERKLRLQLERELRSERARGFSDGSGSQGGSNLGSPDGSGESAAELKRQLREREEKIMRLEGEVAKWEQRYLEESALRQAAIDAASIPKDAKIAALEKTSQETEKLIAEARTEKIRHMDEVHAAQKKVADLESRLKEQESKLAERDAMIRVLQKHTYDKDVSSSSSYPSTLGRSPHHTPHPSLHTNSTGLGSREELDPVSTTSVFSTVSSVLTSSYAGSDSYTTLARSKYNSNKSFDDTKKSLDDQLKELDSQLDSQLLSKRGLCCFPGFSNTSTSPRKGKISKPLLAGVGGGFEAGAGFLQGLVSPRHDQDRPEDMLLLEKQGRCSQQQRMQETCLGPRNRSGSLPPSSLPRPHRSHRPPAKLGDYGRLSDAESRNQSSDKGVPVGRLGDYGRLSDVESKKIDVSHSNIPPPRRLGDYGRFHNSDARKTIDLPNKGRESPRSQIVPPRKLGEYGRLSDGSGGKPASRGGSSTKSGRDSGSEDSGSQSKLPLLPSPRAQSLTRDPTKSSAADSKSMLSSGKYRIQF